jgi:hypothetical protein
MHYPHPKFLQQLANGSLDQIQNLTRAIRLWVLLSWFYTEQANTALSEDFSYSDWRNLTKKLNDLIRVLGSAKNVLPHELDVIA